VTIDGEDGYGTLANKRCIDKKERSGKMGDLDSGKRSGLGGRLNNISGRSARTILGGFLWGVVLTAQSKYVGN